MVLLEGGQLEAFKGTIPSDQSFQKPVPPYPDSGVVYAGKAKDQSKQGNEFILKSQDPFCWVINRDNVVTGYENLTRSGMQLYITAITLEHSSIAAIAGATAHEKISLSESASSPTLLQTVIYTNEFGHLFWSLPQPLRFKENINVYFPFNVASGENLSLQVFGFTEPL